VEHATTLEVTGLTTDLVRRGRSVRVVDGVSFRVAPGETLGIVGESGSGKTISALSVLGLLPTGMRVVGGSVRLEGEELVGASRSRLRALRGAAVGMIFQDPLSSLNPSKTIGWQVAEPLRIHRRMSAAEARERARSLLELVGIPSPEERLRAYPHQLSGGMRQRVMIAIALACEPKLIIADEPTTALDVTIQAQILGLLSDLQARLGTAMVLVTHDLGVIAGRTDRVVVMYAGRVVESAATAELFAQMRHPYTQALLASIPSVGAPRSERLPSIPGTPPPLGGLGEGCAFAPRCPRADEICRASSPPLVAAGGGHEVACWHPVGGPARRERIVVGDAAAASGTEVLVSVEGLHKRFEVHSALTRRHLGTVHAVAGVDLAIHRGETIGLVGESGCGKTTFGRMLAGLERPTTGRILLDGVDLASATGAERRRLHRRVQLMFQDPFASLDPRMRVASALAEPLRVQGMAHDEERLGGLLERVGLPREALWRYPHEFSGGQRQRIGLARALALEPDLVVADEPVSALDVSIRSQILNLMRDTQRERGLSYLVISHDLSVVSYLADRIGVMYLGRVVEIGPSEGVVGEPAHPYTRALLRSVPLPDPEREAAKRRAGAVVQGELPSALHLPPGCAFAARCPFATGTCREEVPSLRMVADRHAVACHRAEDVLGEPWSLADVGNMADAERTR